MYNRRYDRVFRMLQQEQTGCARGTLEPWGSCVLEIKNGRGRLSGSVRELRPLGQGYAVHALLGEESIFCGRLFPNGTDGQAELFWEFLPDDLGQKKTVEDMKTVFILGEGGMLPLAAYFGEETPVGELLSRRKKAERTGPKARPEQEKTPVPVRKTEPPEKKTEAEEKQTVFSEHAAENTPIHAAEAVCTAKEKKKETGEQFHGSFRRMVMQFKRELAELEEAGILTKEDRQRIFRPAPREAETEPREEKKKKREKTAEEAEEAEELPPKEKEKPPSPLTLFSENESIFPFPSGEEWKRISLAELAGFSGIPLSWQKEFFFLLAERKYHHLIFGETAERVFVGVPALLDDGGAERAEELGFGEFRSVSGKTGYWLFSKEKEEFFRK